LLFSVFSLSAEEYRWKVGVARSNMTPEKSRALGGFEFRDRPAEGALHDLWIKVLAVEDAQGNRAVLITAEMVGLVKPISHRIRNRLKNQFNLSKSQIILNASHTHSGPVIMDELHDYYMHPFDEEEIKLIQEYTDSLENNIIACVERAIHSMRPAQIFTGNGLTRFQVNRRNNIEANISDVSELKGPHDPAVPVIKIEDLSG